MGLALFEGQRGAVYTFFFAPRLTGLPRLELAVALTLGCSFFGFLVSRLPRFFSLDMVWFP